MITRIIIFFGSHFCYSGELDPVFKAKWECRIRFETSIALYKDRKPAEAKNQYMAPVAAILPIQSGLLGPYRC